MYTVSFWRPWPTFILRTDADRKECENRPIAPPKAALGQRIALHAGQKYGIGDWPFDGDPPTDAESPKGIVGTAVLAGYLDTRKGKRDTIWDGNHRTTLFNTLDICGRLARLDRSPWWGGPVGLLLVEPRTLSEPVPCKGQQGWWKLPEETVALIRERGGV